MIGSFLTRGLVMVFGYAYPAYECYKTVEKNRPEIEQLRFWCQYWILVAVLTVCERLGDAFISWVPMYSEAKLAFFIYLWYPKTKGTAYVYDSFFRPYVSKHETDIDRNLLELRTRAGDMAVLYCQRAASYGQTRIFEILQYIALQSTPAPPAAKTSQKEAKPSQTTAAPPRQTSVGPNKQPAPAPSRQTSTGANRKPAAPSRQSSTAAPSRQSSIASQSDAEEPLSPTSSTSSSQHQNEVEEVVGPSKRPKAAPTAPASRAQKATTSSDATIRPTKSEADAMQIEVVPPPSTKENGDHPSPKETVMEEAIRVTRGRLRRTRTAGAR